MEQEKIQLRKEKEEAEEKYVQTDEALKEVRNEWISKHVVGLLILRILELKRQFWLFHSQDSKE